MLCCNCGGIAEPAKISLKPSGAVSTHARARDYGIQSLDVLRLLAQKPWIGSHNHWDRGRPIDDELENNVLDNEPQLSNDVIEHDVDEDLRSASEKRSAVASALNSGRRRRQPAPALGVLNDVTTFFDSLRDNIETLASLSPQERSTLFQEPPTVVQASNNGGSGGYGKLHTLRPLRPTTSRSYNRRSSMEAEVEYPRANHHNPELLWTGLGR